VENVWISGEPVFGNINMVADQITHRVVVRLSTTSWLDKHGKLCLKKTLSTSKRYSSGHNFLLEDGVNIGSKEVIESITNLYECPDGLYEVVIYNELVDWESGTIEDFSYKLIPFTV